MQPMRTSSPRSCSLPVELMRTPSPRCRPMHQLPSDVDVMADIMVRVKLSRPTRGFKYVKNRDGHILKGAPASRQQEQFDWVFSQFGSSYSLHVSSF
jgi:hypothetical protein